MVDPGVIGASVRRGARAPPPKRYSVRTVTFDSYKSEMSVIGVARIQDGPSCVSVTFQFATKKLFVTAKKFDFGGPKALDRQRAKRVRVSTL